MMKPLKIEATIDKGGPTKHLTLIVEEYHPFEPSAYVWDSGWSCYDEDMGDWYYVSESGDVYLDGSDAKIGEAPAIKEMQQV